MGIGDCWGGTSSARAGREEEEGGKIDYKRKTYRQTSTSQADITRKTLIRVQIIMK